MDTKNQKELHACLKAYNKLVDEYDDVCSAISGHPSASYYLKKAEAKVDKFIKEHPWIQSFPEFEPLETLDPEEIDLNSCAFLLDVNFRREAHEKRRAEKIKQAGNK